MAGNHRLWTPETSGFDSFMMGMEASAKHPQGNDPVIKAIGQACLAEADQPYMRSMVDTSLGLRSPTPPNHGAGLIRIAVFQKPILFPNAYNDHLEDNYPPAIDDLYNDLDREYDYESEMNRDNDPFEPFHKGDEPCVEEARRFLRRTYNTDSPQRENTIHALRDLYVGTSDERRYYLPLVLASAIEHARPGYFGEAIDIADFGCGNNTGLMRMALRNVTKEKGPKPPQVKDSDPALAALYTRGIERLWNEAPKLGIGLGIDIMNKWLPRIIRWRASSRYPKEYIRNSPDYIKVEVDNVIENMNLGNVKFHVGDITKIQFDQLRKALGQYAGAINMFELGVASTVLYEQTRGQQGDTVESLGRVARLGALNDFGRVDPSDPSRFAIKDGPLGKHPYVTVAVDLQTKQRIFHEWFVSENGRVRSTRLGPGFGYLNGEQIFTPEDLAALGAA